MNRELFGTYDTKKFTDVYPDIETFRKGDVEGTIFGYENNPFSKFFKQDSSLDTVFYLLLSKYANSHIKNMDLSQFQLRLWSIMFQYGPTWEKKLDLQAKLRDLTEDDMRTGSKQVFNKSFNPSVEPTTDTLEELPTINEQNTAKWKKSKIEAYTQLQLMLNDNITEKFINRFNTLFLQMVQPYDELLYATDKKEEE